MIAAHQDSTLSKQRFLDQPTFDEVVFGDGETQQCYGFEEFRDLPLRQRVHLLLSKRPRFYREGEQISSIEAMRFQG
jgi:hypothetical protein